MSIPKHEYPSPLKENITGRDLAGRPLRDACRGKILEAWFTCDNDTEAVEGDWVDGVRDAVLADTHRRSYQRSSAIYLKPTVFLCHQPACVRFPWKPPRVWSCDRLLEAVVSYGCNCKVVVGAGKGDTVCCVPQRERESLRLRSFPQTRSTRKCV